MGSPNTLLIGRKWKNGHLCACAIKKSTRNNRRNRAFSLRQRGFLVVAPMFFFLVIQVLKCWRWRQHNDVSCEQAQSQVHTYYSASAIVNVNRRGTDCHYMEEMSSWEGDAGTNGAVVQLYSACRFYRMMLYTAQYSGPSVCPGTCRYCAKKTKRIVATHWLHRRIASSELSIIT